MAIKNLQKASEMLDSILDSMVLPMGGFASRGAAATIREVIWLVAGRALISVCYFRTTDGLRIKNGQAKWAEKKIQKPSLGWWLVISQRAL